MKLADDYHVLPVTFQGTLGEMVLNLSLIVAEDGVTLIDASMPGHADEVLRAIEKEGFQASDVKRILITHHDIDHIGALAQLKEATGAQVIAHALEKPYVEGKQQIVKYPSAERIAQNPGIKDMFDRIGFAAVDKIVEDGEVIGGARVIATPGHTPGHISLLTEHGKILVTGDALTSNEGKLMGPSQSATPDMPTAIQSVRRLALLDDISAIVTYHGGLVDQDALAQLKALSAQVG